MDEKDKAIQKGVSVGDPMRKKKNCNSSEYSLDNSLVWKRLIHEAINPENRYLIIWRFIFQVSVIIFCFNFPYR